MSMKYSQADPANPLDGSEMLGITQGGLDVRTTTGDIAGLAAGAGVTAEDREALSALAATVGDARILVEAGREGIFIFDDSDLSAEVTADTAEGIYIAPDSDVTGATGAWVRKFEGPINPVWFGLVSGNAAGANGAANSAVIDAMNAVRQVRAINVITDYQGLEAVLTPHGYFELDETLEFTEGTGIFEGSGYHAVPDAAATIFKFPAGVTGIRVQRYNTSALTTDGVTHRGGDRTILRNFALIGGYAGVEDEFHGIHLRAGAIIEHVSVQEFEGDGIYSRTTAGAGGATEGNANNCRIYNVRVQECRNGFYVDGADVNIWLVMGLDSRTNRQWGVWDSSFLGNTYIGCHTASNDIDVATTQSLTSNGGNRYSVVAGMEAAALLNAPSGDTSDNTWWLWVAAGDGGVAAWPAVSYRAGGSYYTDNANGRSAFFGCYTESGQGRAQLAVPSLAFGGILAKSNTPGSIYRDSSGISALAWRSFATKADGSTTEVILGATTNATTKSVALQFTDSVAYPSTLRLQVSGLDMVWDYQNSGSARIALFSGPSTTQEFGTGAAVTHAFYPYQLMIGSTVTNGRLVTNGTAAPTTGAHGAGEVVINRTPATNNVFAWVCTVAGTPGTWIPIPARGGVVTKSTTNPTAALTDSNCYLRFTNGSAIAFTIPPNSSVAFPIGVQIEGIQAGAGALTITPGAGVTINSYGPDLVLAGQYAGFTLIKVGTDEWDVHGKFS